MQFEIIEGPTSIEIMATGRGIRELSRPNKVCGRGRWRKRKGIATIRLSDGSEWRGELHWYEGTGIGKKEYKIKRFIR